MKKILHSKRGRILKTHPLEKKSTMRKVMKAMQEIANAKAQKSQPPLIDILHDAILKAGYAVERDGWRENEFSKPPNDRCSWLDIKLFDEENNLVEVHLYFTQNSTRLDEVSVFKSKKKTGFGTPNLIAKRTWDKEKQV